MARWREHSAGGGWAWQAENGSWLGKTLLPLRLTLRQLLSMALESLFLAHKRVAVLRSQTPSEAELGSVRLTEREGKEEKHAQQRDRERNRSRVIFNASLQACLKIEREPFPSN